MAMPLEPLVAAVAAALASSPVLADRLPREAEASVAFADDSQVASLNESYRGKAGPTNVLSFPVPGRGPREAPQHIGDIILAAGVIAAEARERDIAVADHVRHLIVHGVLHLLGYDHESEADALVMEAAERGILATLGVADPYPDPD
jgi:probable rRNA maturation factor